jgi:hypothetical protein
MADACNGRWMTMYFGLGPLLVTGRTITIISGHAFILLAMSQLLLVTKCLGLMYFKSTHFSSLPSSSLD